MPTGVAIGIDVGGSSIKAAAVDTAAATLIGERQHVDVVDQWRPGSLVAAIAECAHRSTPPGAGAPPVIGVGFPAVVVRGVPRTDPTALQHPGFRGLDLHAALREATGAEVTVINDADAAGVAEVHHGAAAGVDGTVILVTLGTGVGSGFFHDRVLVPNVELGHLHLAGDPDVVELSMAARIKTEQHLSWDAYVERLNAFLERVVRLFCPDLVILGGGITDDDDDAAELLGRVDAQVEVRRARFGNDAGLIGAATHAAALRP